MKKKRRRSTAGRPLWNKGDRNYGDPRYNKWRADVKKRDGYKCMRCGSTERLHVHHIRRWADMPTIRFMVSNGITLCKKHHDEVKGNEDAYAPLFLTLIRKREAENKGGL